MMGRVLVTGGAGFIGSHTVDRLKKLGYSVMILDGLTPPVHPNRGLPPWLSWCRQGYDYVYGDVTKKVCWEEALRGIDYVIHLAAYQDYLPNFSTFFDTNTVGTALLYETIVANKLPVKKVVIASSQAVYGEGAYRCPREGLHLVYPSLRSEVQLQLGCWDPICPECKGQVLPVKTDEEAVNPHNAYAISKYTQEQIGLTLGRRYGIPTTALRYSIVQGPRQSFHNAYSGILRRFTLQLLHDEPVTIYEDGQQVRDYVAVQDVVDANLLALEDSRTDYEVYNVGGDRQVTVREYLDRLVTKLGKELRWTFGGYRFGDTRHVISDVSKLKALGWSPQVSLDEIIEGYLDWVKTQPYAKVRTTQADTVMRATGVVRRSK